MTNAEEKKFHIIRIDSNDNHFLEESNLSEEAADAFVERRTKEIGTHHQKIWKQDASLPLPEPIYR